MVYNTVWLKILDFFCQNFYYTIRGVAQLVARHIWDVDVACSSHVTPTTNRITGSFEGCDAVLFFTGVTIRYAPSSTILVGEKYQVSIFPCTVVVKLSIILDTFYSNKYHAARFKHS